jgi:hypothetical protein
MSKSKDYYIKEFKNQMDRGINFVEYFLSIGLPNNIIYNPFLYENNTKKLNESDLIKPEITSQFPSFDKSTIHIDSNIIKYIFPNGFKLIESMTTPEVQEFSLTLDNDHYYLNNEKIYVNCLIFYESLEDYYNKLFWKNTKNIIEKIEKDEKNKDKDKDKDKEIADLLKIEKPGSDDYISDRLLTDNIVRPNSKSTYDKKEKEDLNIKSQRMSELFSFKIK